MLNQAIVEKGEMTPVKKYPHGVIAEIISPRHIESLKKRCQVTPLGVLRKLPKGKYGCTLIVGWCFFEKKIR